MPGLRTIYGKAVGKQRDWHLRKINDYTMYTVEDLNGTKVSPYAYELEFLPQALVPVKITAHEIAEDIAGK